MSVEHKPATRTTRLHRALYALCLPLLVTSFWLGGNALGHGDTAPQPVDTGKLPKLGETNWLETDPFRTGEHHDEAVRVGSRGYNANCARCHGLEAISGGIAPDLRAMTRDCAGDADCINDMEGYYLETIRKGRVRDGRVYMPPFEGILSQEAMWAIWTYVETQPKDE